MLGMGGSLSADPASLVFEDLTSYKDLAFYFKNGVEIDVNQWDDSSGNDNHISQANASYQASVGLGGLRLDGADDHYDLASSVSIGVENPFTLFWVGQTSDYDTPNGLLSEAPIAESSAEFTIRSTTSITFTGSGLEAAATFNFASGTFPTRTEMQLCIVKNASRIFTFYKNGVKISPVETINHPAVSAPFDAIQIGAIPDGEGGHVYYSGYIYELALYERELSYAEIYTISNYLSNKLL